MQFFTRDDFTGTIQKQRQYLEGLILKFDSDAMLEKLIRPQIHFERPETNASDL